jgi:hypothetical protein
MLNTLFHFLDICHLISEEPPQVEISDSIDHLISDCVDQGISDC